MGIYQKDQLERDSRTLEEFIYLRLDPLEVCQGSQIFAEHQVVHAIKEWSTSITSQILWISTTLPTSRPSPPLSSMLRMKPQSQRCTYFSIGLQMSDSPSSTCSTPS